MQLPRLIWKPRWFIDDTVLEREGSRSQGRKLTYKALELGSNNFSVTLVAACMASVHYAKSAFLLMSVAHSGFLHQFIPPIHLQ
jgi:hypothetical protein